MSKPICIILHKIPFAEGVEFLRNSKTIKILERYKDGDQFAQQNYWINYAEGDGNDYDPILHLLDNGKVLAMVSAWDVGYYDEISAEEPLWYLGEIEDLHE